MPATLPAPLLPFGKCCGDETEPDLLNSAVAPDAPTMRPQLAPAIFGADLGALASCNRAGQTKNRPYDF
jgi:hypothetical protein